MAASGGEHRLPRRHVHPPPRPGKPAGRGPRQGAKAAPARVAFGPPTRKRLSRLRERTCRAPGRSRMRFAFARAGRPCRRDDHNGRGARSFRGRSRRRRCPKGNARCGAPGGLLPGGTRERPYTFGGRFPVRFHGCRAMRGTTARPDGAARRRARARVHAGRGRPGEHPVDGRDQRLDAARRAAGALARTARGPGGRACRGTAVRRAPRPGRSVRARTQFRCRHRDGLPLWPSRPGGRGVPRRAAAAANAAETARSTVRAVAVAGQGSAEQSGT